MVVKMGTNKGSKFLLGLKIGVRGGQELGGSENRGGRPAWGRNILKRE